MGRSSAAHKGKATQADAKRGGNGRFGVKRKPLDDLERCPSATHEPEYHHDPAWYSDDSDSDSDCDARDDFWEDAKVGDPDAGLDVAAFMRTSQKEQARLSKFKKNRVGYEGDRKATREPPAR